MKYIDKYRNYIVAVLITISIVIFLQAPIKSYLLKEQQVTDLRITKSSVKENEEKEASYDFDSVQSIDLTNLITNNLSTAKINAIGEVAVPSVGINLPITKGVSNESMLVSAGTLKPNQKMGEGNYTLASHYTPAENETLLFGPLYRVAINDYIYLTDADKIYSYKITDKYQVNERQVEVLNDSENPIITLITCEAVDSPFRIIVRGKLENIYDIKNAPEKVKDAFSMISKTF